jgi:hypothetical protein
VPWLSVSKPKKLLEQMRDVRNGRNNDQGRDYRRVEALVLIVATGGDLGYKRYQREAG